MNIHNYFLRRRCEVMKRARGSPGLSRLAAMLLLTSLPLLLWCCCGEVARAQEVAVDTQVLRYGAASTALRVRLHNDHPCEQRASVALRLPDDARDVHMTASQASMGVVVATATDEKDALSAIAQGAGKMAVVSYPRASCDQCFDVEMLIPGRSVLTLNINYNQTLTRPEVCAPEVRLRLPRPPSICRPTKNNFNFSVNVSGNLRQPYMNAEVCDFSEGCNECNCTSAQAHTTLSESAASFQWNRLPYDVYSAPRVCTYFKWADKDSVTVLTPDVQAPPRGQFVVFVIDTSDNVTDKDLQKVKEVFANEVRNLNEGDTFSVVNYAKRPQVWTRGSQDIFEGTDENIREAICHVNSLKKDAGSSLVEGLSRALELVLKAKATQQACGGRASVVMITGWTPGGGNPDIRRAVEWLQNLNKRAGASLYAVAVGDTVNTCALLDLLAFNGGLLTRLRDLQPHGSVVQQSRLPQKGVSLPEYVAPTIYNLTVHSRVEMRYAVTVITSKVYNPAKYSQEVVYSAVLPNNAFVSGFTIEDKGNVYQSEVIPRGLKPVTIVSTNHSARVDTSARDSNVILISLNVAARGEMIFRLTYEELLEKENNFYTLKLNVDPRQIVEHLEMIVSVKDATNITAFKYLRPTRDSSNEIDFAPFLPKTEFGIKWTPGAEEQMRMLSEGSRQLEVHYQLDQNVTQQIIITEDGYFVHFFSPNDIVPVWKHVVFVLDVSTSMKGRKIAQMKEAMNVVLDDLLITDSFSLVHFSTETKVWTGGNNCEVLASKGSAKIANISDIPQAKICVDGLVAQGGTKLTEALKVSIATSLSQQALGAEVMIIVLTDGDPTEGKDAVLNFFRSSPGRSVMVFSLGLGDDVDMHFLQQLSALSEASAKKIYVASDTVPQLRDFYREISGVALSHLNFTYHGVTNLTKTDIRSFIIGTEIVVVGKLPPGAEDLVGGVQASHGLTKVNFTLPKAVRTDFANVERLWAFLRVKQLMEKDRATATATALKYKFLTPLTSLVINGPQGDIVVDETPVVVVETTGPPSPPPPQPTVCDTYFQTDANRDAVNVTFNSGFSLTDLDWNYSDLAVLSKPTGNSNVAFNSCWTSELKAGNCRHLLHCVLPVFVGNRTRFEADRCSVPGGNAGVCCPNSLFPKVLDQ